MISQVARRLVLGHFSVSQTELLFLFLDIQTLGPEPYMLLTLSYKITYSFVHAEMKIRPIRDTGKVRATLKASLMG